MIVVRGETFTDATVPLDGRHFIDCELTGCILQYAGGDLTLERTGIHDCRPLLLGAAGRTFSFFKALGYLPLDFPLFLGLEDGHGDGHGNGHDGEA